VLIGGAAGDTLTGGNGEDLELAARERHAETARSSDVLLREATIRCRPAASTTS